MNNNKAGMMDQILAEYTDMNGCMPNPTPFPSKTPEAMAYVPFQQFGTMYPPEKGLQTGTIFPELDKPFLGAGGV